MQILIALTLQFWSASHSIIMGYQNKHSERHRKLIYFNISFCKYRTNTHVYWLYLWYQTYIARLFLPYQAATAHCISLRLCEWVCVTVVGLLWLVLWQNSAKILAHVWAVTMHLSAITAQKKEIVFVYKYKKAKKSPQAGFSSFFGHLLIKLHLLISYSWPQHDLTLSPTHHHAYTDTSCSLSKQLCSHYFFIVCLTYVSLDLQKKNKLIIGIR